MYIRGLGFLELNPDAASFIETQAFTSGAPYIKVDMVLHRMHGEKNSFDTVEKIAQTNGHAVVLVPNHPAIIKHLAVWIMKVAEADYIIAPVSAIYDLPLHTDSSVATGHTIPPSTQMHNSDASHNEGH